MLRKVLLRTAAPSPLFASGVLAKVQPGVLDAFDRARSGAISQEKLTNMPNNTLQLKDLV